jgi:hypothetical protein
MEVANSVAWVMGVIGAGQDAYIKTTVNGIGEKAGLYSGEFSGISGFSHIMGKLYIVFKDREEAQDILELARFANMQSRKPLVDDELHFISKYPDVARELLTMVPGQ